jgi:putative membrane protein
LIAAAVALTVVMIFIIQNAHPVNISFLGVHLILPLAIGLILAAATGALLMAAAGTARITQLRRIIRRSSAETRCRISTVAFGVAARSLGAGRLPPGSGELCLRLSSG